MPGRTDAGRSPSGFTLIEIVITLLILGMVGLMVNGVLVRLAQTNIAASNVAERLPVAGTALNLIRQRLLDGGQDADPGRLILAPGGTDAGNYRFKYVRKEGGDGVAGLLPGDWLADSPSVKLSEEYVPGRPEGAGVPAGISIPGSLKGARCYEVELNVVFDPSTGLSDRLRLSVEGAQ